MVVAWLRTPRRWGARRGCRPRRRRRAAQRSALIRGELGQRPFQALVGSDRFAMQDLDESLPEGHPKDGQARRMVDPEIMRAMASADGSDMMLDEPPDDAVGDLSGGSTSRLLHHLTLGGNGHAARLLGTPWERKGQQRQGGRAAADNSNNSGGDGGGEAGGVAAHVRHSTVTERYLPYLQPQPPPQQGEEEAAEAGGRATGAGGSGGADGGRPGW